MPQSVWLIPRGLPRRMPTMLGISAPNRVALADKANSAKGKILSAGEFREERMQPRPLSTPDAN